MLLLKSLWNYFHLVGELSKSQKQAVVTLIEKKGRDKRLMNVDVKIASKALSFHTEQENIDGVLFAADIEKGFDSVEHCFIFAVLKKFGFGDDFIQWIKTFLFDASNCVMNNNFSTWYFKIDHGTRQGDPLSAYIFILCLEIFFIQVRSDISIRGFKYNDVEIKLTAFADDTTFLVRDIQSLRRMLNLAKYFQPYSSLKFNVEKCEACWIGTAKGQSSKPIHCKWINLNWSSMKSLGAQQLVEKMNFNQVTTDCRILLNT